MSNLVYVNEEVSTEQALAEVRHNQWHREHNEREEEAR